MPLTSTTFQLDTDIQYDMLNPPDKECLGNMNFLISIPFYNSTYQAVPHLNF